jgi:general secretion pathway protein E/type IV pilus assembly protein PilB
MIEIIEKMLGEKLLDSQGAERVKISLSEGNGLQKSLLSSGLSEDKLLCYLSEHFSYPYINLEEQPPSKEFLLGFPARILLDKMLLPLEQTNGSVLVATSDPFDTSGLEELRLATGKDFRLALAPSSEIDRCIKRSLGVGADTVQSMVSAAGEDGFEVIADDIEEDMDLTDAAEGASIIRFVNQILSEALESRATDVHIEPFENELRVRYRIDGVLQQATIPPEVKQFQAAIVSRLKILSRLDIAEKRVPQDGRIKIKLSNREVDVRVSVIPMLYGEAVVLRLLDRTSVLLGLDKLGMGVEDMDKFSHVITRPHGIILVTGPTGSGKTTTLYAALSQINDIERKIITIEDPIEYQLHGINQIQVSRKAGLTFAKGLRSILRHDPDVVLIGEIRDQETAEIAVQASLTGHLVFSTLHTNDAPGAMTRLVDMGIEPYLVASSLEAVIAQRLVRMICTHCREKYSPKNIESLRAEFRQDLPETLYRGAGCRQCQGTGYLGRRGIYEEMLVTEDIRSLILSNSSARQIRNMAVHQGMKTLRTDACRYLENGQTTVEEIMRVTKDDQITEGGGSNA